MERDPRTNNRLQSRDVHVSPKIVYHSSSIEHVSIETINNFYFYSTRKPTRTMVPQMPYVRLLKEKACSCDTSINKVADDFL